MVVIEERRGRLLVRINSLLCGSRSDPVVRVPIAIRCYMPAVQMNDGAYFGDVGTRAGKIVINDKTMPWRQLVAPLDMDGAAAADC
jgi:hypothetical protein